jgi:uncharacterized protein YjiK
MATLIILVWFWAGPSDLPEIKGYDFSSKHILQHRLPDELAEASGLAFTSDGRLLCHNDEQGIIFEVDDKTGKILKRCFLGKLVTYRDDLEGIAVKQGHAHRDTVFLVNSSGTIVRGLLGKDQERVSFQTFKTPLNASNNVEGLTYDPVTDCLLLACKGEAGKDDDGQKAVYAFSLKTYSLLPQPRFLISVKKITAQTGKKEFNPSAIERHPRTGHFFVLAAKGNAIVELDEKGEVLAVSSLPKSVNPQPEGLAIAPDGTAVICSEGQGQAGRISVYPPK